MIMLEPRLELKIGSPIKALDGACGHVQQVILDPQDGRIVALVVWPGVLSDYPVVVPTECVANATDDEVQLKISRAQVVALPGFGTEVELGVGGQHYDVDDKSVATRDGTGGESKYISDATRPALALRAGQQVLCSEGHAGNVTLLRLSPQGWVRHLVMHLGHLPGRQVIVPVEWVCKVDQHHVYLAADLHALDGLPDYRRDDDIAAEVGRALWEDDVLRQTDYHEIAYTVNDGVVTLNGHVMTSAIKARARWAIRSVEGVLRVENHLISDDELEILVAQTLGHDVHVRKQSVYVHARHGVISLCGEVISAAMRAAAEECAASVPQVRGVVNHIKAPGIVEAEDQRVLQPRAGQEVYTDDGLIGHVERVILSPRNRRVTAFVMYIEFPDPTGSEPHGLPDEMSHAVRERQVVVPIAMVRLVNASGVELRAGSTEVAHCKQFDLTSFVSPFAGWRPPYPYRCTDVLLDPGKNMKTEQSNNMVQE
jgi:osmotically-inducible protein OsmY/sporulation protein YlmC with PRC-barrel domain